MPMNRVLVVDDEHEICNLLSRELTRLNYEVETAHSGEEALQKIAASSFHVVLSDLKMPGMGGVAFIRELKKVAPETEVIVVTAYGSMDSVMECFREGAFDYIIKPFSIVEVHHKTAKAVDRYHGRTAMKLLNENLTSTYIELEKLKDSLEEKVLERTEELARSEKSYRQIIDGSFDPIFTITPENRISGWNKGAELTFGYTAAETLGKPVDMLFLVHPERVIQTMRERVIAEQGYIRNYITRCLTRGAIEIDVNITASLLDDGTLSCIMRDITREKKIEQLKADFVSNVSHELRTPLTSVKGAVELILTGVEGALTDSQKELLGIVRNNAVRLIRLISELLDVSKIESGKMQMEIKPGDLIPLLKLALDEMKPLAAKKSITLRLDLPAHLPYADFDEHRIRQVLTNLIGNAVKFTPEQGVIALAAAMQGNEVRLSVSDTGIGIARENHDMVFEKFRQVDSSSTRAAGGTGLGLSITKSIVEAHHGRIWIESEIGQGSTFHFTVPLSLTQAQPDVAALDAALEAAVAQQDFSIRRILVVDDDKDLTTIISGHLEKKGYEITIANSGMDAIKKAIDLQPQLILLDLLMPQVDGYFVAKLLKQNPRTKDIPIVIVSAVFEQEKCFRLGIADYITKPFDSAVLYEAVGRIEKQVKGEKLKRKVLVVDDDPDIITVLTLSLTERNYIVLNAYDGIQAIALAKKEKPDLIILDLMLPSVDGFSVIKALKGDPEVADIPIIVVTGRTIEDREKAIQLGAREYLIKPFTMRILYEELDKIMDKEVRPDGEKKDSAG